MRRLVEYAILIALSSALASCSDSELLSEKVPVNDRSTTQLDSVMAFYFSEIDKLHQGTSYSSPEGVDISAINMFVESLTGIISKSDHNYFGLIYVEEEDAEKWKNWYQINKEYLRLEGNEIYDSNRDRYFSLP